MSMSVVGVRNLDGQFAKMAALKKACDDLGIPYPPELKDYFKYPDESIDFLRQEMEEISIEEASRKLPQSGADVIEVDLAKLSREVKAIRCRYSH